MAAQGSLKVTGKHMQAALVLTAALRGESARWTSHADELEVCLMPERRAAASCVLLPLRLQHMWDHCRQQLGCRWR